MSRLVWLLALFGLVSGCATPTLYSWGHYEELVYVSYAQPGKVSPEMQVEKLEVYRTRFLGHRARRGDDDPRARVG